MKVVLVGDTQVGKTCLVQRLISGTFRGSSPPTVGAAFQDHVMTTEKGVVSMQIWDTAGQEKYRSLAPMYYRNAQAAILVFDLTNTQSYEALEQWATELEEKSSTEIKLFIVGNKCDLTEQRAVSKEEAEEFTYRHGGMAYIETSAKNGTGVLQLFTKVAESCETIGKSEEVAEPVVVNTYNSSTTGTKTGCQC